MERNVNEIWVNNHKNRSTQYHKYRHMVRFGGSCRNKGWLIQLHETGKRIKRLREEAGINQAELSRRIGIPQTTLSGYELGQRDVAAEWLREIALLFDVSVDYLVGLTDNRKGIRQLDIVLIEDGCDHVRVGEFLDQLQKLSPKWIGIINSMVENLVKE